MDFILAFCLLTYIVVCGFMLATWDVLVEDGVPNWVLVLICVTSPLSFFLLVYYIVKAKDNGSKNP